MKKCLICLCLCLFVASCSTWYKKYGMTRKNDVLLASSASNLVRALDDPSPNVRRAALANLQRHLSSVRIGEEKIAWIAKNDPNYNVQREAYKALSILSSQIYTGRYVVNRKNYLQINGMEIPLNWNRNTEFEPSNYFPSPGDWLTIDGYEFEGQIYSRKIRSGLQSLLQDVESRVAESVVAEQTQRRNDAAQGNTLETIAKINLQAIKAYQADNSDLAVQSLAGVGQLSPTFTSKAY